MTDSTTASAVFTLQASTPPPPSSPLQGLWTSREELATLPTSGPAWATVLKGAQQATTNPALQDQDNHTSVFVLAKAIVWARTGEARYRTEAIASLEELVRRGFVGGRTLAWGRNLAGYVLAADLLGYRTPAFEEYVRQVAEVWQCSQISACGTSRKATMREMFEKRPSNWGSHAFFSLAVAYR